MSLEKCRQSIYSIGGIIQRYKLVVGYALKHTSLSPDQQQPKNVDKRKTIQNLIIRIEIVKFSRLCGLDANLHVNIEANIFQNKMTKLKEKAE